MQAGIESRDLAAGAAELRRGGETGESAAGDANVIHDMDSDLRMQIFAALAATAP
ncbi:hypothetical protein FHS96_003920 [Sphingomonas zeicaulis]|uniref:hypothetical protein n=1 Tax=Sphingomonas zeicaulis TaxID=1632740 RepID=UPI003D19C5C3